MRVGEIERAPFFEGFGLKVKFKASLGLRTKDLGFKVFRSAKRRQLFYCTAGKMCGAHVGAVMERSPKRGLLCNRSLSGGYHVYVP